MKIVKLKYVALFVLVIAGCSSPTENKQTPLVEEVSLGSDSDLGYPVKLSEWKLFDGNPSDLNPVAHGLPYELNTPLFTDYAHKSRFVLLPDGEKMQFSATEVFDFPEESILVKTFYYPADFSQPGKDLRLIETRLLIHRENDWEAITYVWDEDQKDATLTVSGASVPVAWVDNNGEKQAINYSVPNLVQCKSCHELNGKMTPIGPKARNLKSKSMGTVDLLTSWYEQGVLGGLSDIKNLESVPDWENLDDGDLADRARAWLDINCAHCHRKEGPAKNTGLYLTYDEVDRFKLGIMKPPVAAGRGSGGLQYAIVPGAPERSILFQRINSLDPGVMMPELGRKMNHTEGIAAVEAWIKQLN
jgi:uncharacterized repeat protein (TIGR03806 family)